MKSLLFAAALSFGASAVAAEADAGHAVVEGTKSADPNAPDTSKMPFTADSIRTVVSYHQPQIQTCYNETLANKGNKVIEGKLHTHWVITPDGLVKQAKVDRKKSTLKEGDLHKCVIEVLSAMTFPKPVKARDYPVEFPFNLTAVK
jgi:hypothetical protein